MDPALGTAAVYLIRGSLGAEALLSPVAVTSKIALCLREISMATIASHMPVFVCVCVSEFTER